ncbi:unnamed protein product, partial [Meganyctiphanes norvegica]
FFFRKEKSKSSDQMLVTNQKEEKSKSSVSLTGSSKRIPDSEASKVGKQELGSNSAALFGDSQTDGRRFGTRSMLIEGTIKRNFIVIHPLDNSETIGIAPVSPHSKNSEVPHTIPKALESVKSKISGAIENNFVSLRKKTKKKNEEHIHIEVEHLDISRNEHSAVIPGPLSPNQSLQNSHSKNEKNKDKNKTNLSEVSSAPLAIDSHIPEKPPLSNITHDRDGTRMQAIADSTPIYKTTLDPGQSLPPIIPEISPLVGEPSEELQPSNAMSAPCGGDISVIEDRATVIENQVVSGHHGLHVTNSNNTTSKLCVVM